MWPHLSASLKLLKLGDIADMHLPAKFLRVLKCGQYIFYKLTENKTDHSILR